MEKQQRIFIGGVWDLFHVGHLNALRSAKSLGNFLVVGINTDKLVYRLKKRYPIIPQRQRLTIVEACRYVDKAIIQNKMSNIKDLVKEKIDILCIGYDWKNKSFEGLDWARKHLKVVYIPRILDINSSMIKHKLGSEDFQL